MFLMGPSQCARTDLTRSATPHNIYPLPFRIREHVKKGQRRGNGYYGPLCIQ